MFEQSDISKIDRKAMLLYGCPESLATSINDGRIPRFADFGSKASGYLGHRTRAARRGIDWLFTFEEWARVWVDSGKWGERGRGKGRYCMARHGDAGPYSEWNVSIQLVEQNSRDGIKVAQTNLRNAGTDSGLVQCGTGRGWTYTKRSKRNPYQVVVAHKYIGCFPTQQDAEDAYKDAAASHIDRRRVAFDESSPFLPV